MSEAIERHSSAALATTAPTGPVSLTPATFEEAKSFASALSKAEGFVPKVFIGNPSAILAAIVMGAEIGIGPMQSLRSIHVIEGKPSLGADLMLALAIRAGVRVEWLQQDAQAARCKLTRHGFPDHRHSFTIDEAKAAGLAGRGNWSKYAPAMLRARCISAALRAWSPDVLGAGVYADGELEDVKQQAPAVVVERVEQPQAEGAPDADVIEAEQSCGQPEPEEREPLSLPGCRTPELLEGWCKEHGAAVVARGMLERVLKQGAEIDVLEGDVSRWCGVEVTS